MKVKVRALKKYYVDRIEHPPGDVFDVDLIESDINILCTIGTLEMIERPASNVAGYIPKIVEPEPPPAQAMTTENTEPLERRKYYRHRKLESEK